MLRVLNLKHPVFGVWLVNGFESLVRCVPKLNLREEGEKKITLKVLEIKFELEVWHLRISSHSQ